jgi:hypothetical protein
MSVIDLCLLATYHTRNAKKGSIILQQTTFPQVSSSIEGCLSAALHSTVKSHSSLYHTRQCARVALTHCLRLNEPR